MNNHSDCLRVFRSRIPISAEIKLLRLALVPSPHSPTEELGMDWAPAQPTENLSPESAANVLGVFLWSTSQVVQKRLRTLHNRYPPEQFVTRYQEWRPAAALIGDATHRLNWFWQSAVIPPFPETEFINLELKARGLPHWKNESLDYLERQTEKD